MKIFLGILTVCIFAVVYAEKDDRKRKHLLLALITTIIATAAVSIISLIFGG